MNVMYHQGGPNPKRLFERGWEKKLILRARPSLVTHFLCGDGPRKKSEQPLFKQRNSTLVPWEVPKRGGGPPSTDPGERKKKQEKTSSPGRVVPYGGTGDKRGRSQGEGRRGLSTKEKVLKSSEVGQIRGEKIPSEGWERSKTYIQKHR